MIRSAATCILLICCCFVFSQSWQNAKSSKTAEIDIYWYVSTPFIYTDANGELTGVEHDMIGLFLRFLAEKYGVTLQTNWIEASNFANIMEKVSETEKANTFGTSAFSITPAREEYLQFTAPYLPDIAVLVSSKGSPIVESTEEINSMMKNMEAVTIAGTTYERFLFDLQQRLSIDFDMIYIESDKNVLDKIAEAPDRFGYIDLPIYLMLIKRGGDLTRQNKFTVRGTGYGLILPQESDWAIPFNEFLKDINYKAEIDAIFSKFLGPELFEFLGEINSQEQLGNSILTKERELQLDLIRNAQLMLADQQRNNQLLMAGILFCLMLLLIIAFLFFRNKKATRELLARKNKIESQQIALKEKSQQLISRNAGLMMLNEEKNNLVRILAHDLRSPLSQIIGIADILHKDHQVALAEDQVLLTKITDGAHRINEMISKILNVESLDRNDSTTVFEEIHIAPLLEEVVQRFASGAREKGIGIVLNNCKEEEMIVTDQVLLLQILDNLVSNAIKFSPKNTQVQVTVEVNKSGVLIKVKDEGPGFSEADQTLMFNKFQKLSAQPTNGEPSTGLGLSIVKRYVEELKGKIWLETAIGKGTTFFVQLDSPNNE